MMEMDHDHTRRPTRVRSAPLKQLNQLAKDHAFSISDVDWTKTLAADKNWMPDDLVNIRFLPSYVRMSEAQRLRYNHIYALALCEQFIWFEIDMVVPILQRLTKRPDLSADLLECLEHFRVDEQKHCEMFRALLRKAGGKAEGYDFYNLNRTQSFFYQSIINNPGFFSAWIWLTIYFEERTMHISRLYREAEGRVDGTFARCHLLHMIDEARHLQVDQYLLTYLYDELPMWNRRLAAKMVEQVFKAYCSPKRISRRILEGLAIEFPESASVFQALIGEFSLLPKNREFKTVMFGDSAIPRTRELLGRYPEMQRTLSIIS